VDDKNLIVIRPISIDDFEEVLHWSRDVNFCLANDWQLNRDPKELYDWWLRCVENQATDFIRLGIEWNNRLIGYADLANMEENTAELGIAIGNSKLWGKGIGSLAATQMIKFAFVTFNISSLHAETHETNLRSRNMLEKLGFQEISRIGTESYQGEDTQLIQYRLTLVS
jgi:[ribosomal protein S5]-alanine N-acetyltransferase